MTSATFSTLKSSGYRTWSTRNLHGGRRYHEGESAEDTFRSHDQSHMMSRSHDQSHMARSHDHRDTSRSHDQNNLRLQLIHNSRGQTQMDLSNKNLHVFPGQVFMFRRLEVLKLQNNRLGEIPLAISRLRSLRSLHLQENNLTFLPETLSNCIHLLEINLTKNHLAGLPTSIGMLKNLRILRLGQNQFECLPHEIGDLDNLRYLDLHGNRLWYLPFSIARLYRLKYLNMANNRFEHLPLPVCKVTSLQILNLRGNALMNLLPDFDGLCHLQELNVAYNKFEIVPQAVFQLKLLLYLNLTGNKLHFLPSAIAMLKNLKVLHVQGNRIEKVPEILPNLQYLNISNNKLQNFSVVDMKRLRSLNANNNRLENIPMGVYSQQKLETLRLNGNQIQYVSPDIVFLKRLKVLDLGNNQLMSFPQVVQKLNRLDFFNVRGNNIKSKISLYNGEIIPQTDFYAKKRKFQNSRQKSHTASRRPKSGAKSFPSQENGVPSSLQSNGNTHKMWDSEDLLENGYSEKHVNNTVSSAYLRKKQPMAVNNTINSAYLKKKQPMRAEETDIIATQESDMLNPQQKYLGHQAELVSNVDTYSMSEMPAISTDYQLLGICNQVEMLLNKQLLQPVLSLSGNPMGKSFSEKAIIETSSGLWRISEDKNETGTSPVAMVTETFTVTPQGGWISSSNDPNISIFLPSNAVSKLTQAHMKILHIEPALLKQLRRDSRLISNILAIGPIIFLKTEDGNHFNHQVTITIPALTSQYEGHQHLLTVNNDNSCVPCSNKYKIRNGYIMIQASSLTGKAAVLTRTSCKYKASKSLEQLLTMLKQDK